MLTGAEPALRVLLRLFGPLEDAGNTPPLDVGSSGTMCCLCEPTMMKWLWLDSCAGSLDNEV